MASENSEHKHVIVDFAKSNTSNNNTVAASLRFRWDKEQRVGDLIRCLANYNSKMEFSNKNFNADKVQQYMRKSENEWLKNFNDRFGYCALMDSKCFFFSM